MLTSPQIHISSRGEGRKRHPLPYFPHQPEKALEVYDEAYRKNPHDASLVSRIGQAYVKTHQYAKVRLPWGGPAMQGREESPYVRALEGKGQSSVSTPATC